MGIFGWDLPPGVSVNDLPGAQDEAVLLNVPGLPEEHQVYWTEDGDVQLLIWKDSSVIYPEALVRSLGTLDWDDNLTEQANYNAAVEFAVNKLSNPVSA